VIGPVDAEAGAVEEGVGGDNRQRLAQTARHYLKVQSTRMCGSRLFGDPGWHLLLELFIAKCDGRKIDKSNAYLASGAPHSTGHRWAEKLRTRGWIEEWPDANDARRGYFIISDEAVEIVAGWLAAMFGQNAMSWANPNDQSAMGFHSR
jgi:hypothetical protein